MAVLISPPELWAFAISAARSTPICAVMLKESSPDVSALDAALLMESATLLETAMTTTIIPIKMFRPDDLVMLLHAFFKMYILPTPFLLYLILPPVSVERMFLF
jgi:hypothetical protein